MENHTRLYRLLFRRFRCWGMEAGERPFDRLLDDVTGYSGFEVDYLLSDLSSI